ncbi:MAG: hypothetical protein JWP88_1765 [Flaviaesturariibacter sp.]|nr:hypothetical protein [Flaviaesturariibacter sp.]
MKKTILALTLIGCGAVAGAQDSLKTNASMQNSNRNEMELGSRQVSTGMYNAYGPAVNVPSSTQSYLLRDYPMAANPTWETSGEWYRANVINNNRNMQVYYAQNGNSFAVALPVIQSWVPEEVVTSALGMYGTSIYSVNRIKGANGQDLYQVTLLENGMSRMEYLNADGTTVAATDVFRTDDMQMNTATGAWENTSSNAAMGTQSGTTINSDVNTGSVINTTSDMSTTNSAGVKTKSKVTNADGSQTKVKMKDGKTKVKEKSSTLGTTSGDMNY